MRIFITNARDWYARYERPISSVSLIGGFVFDALTLKRVDFFWENLWVVAHLLIVALCIILINRQEEGDMDYKDPARAHFWYINILQFFFGGLLSTYLVFYFRSATLSAAWPFLLLLGLAFWANESLKKYYARLTFQISLFFLSLLAFAVYIVPVLLHQIGPDVFMVSGLASMLALWLFLRGLGFSTGKRLITSRVSLIVSILGIFFATNLLYFFNLIPPIPLSLKEAGIYHSLVASGPGNYTMQYEDGGWRDYFKLHPTFHTVFGETAYAYSSIFSPAQFETNIIHEWERYNATTNQWTTVSRVKLSALGGNEGGYRTYSILQNIAPGDWRVNVETENGQVIGRMRFEVVAVGAKPTLKTLIKD